MPTGKTIQPHTSLIGDYRYLERDEDRHIIYDPYTGEKIELEYLAVSKPPKKITTPVWKCIPSPVGKKNNRVPLKLVQALSLHLDLMPIGRRNFLWVEANSLSYNDAVRILMRRSYVPEKDGFIHNQNGDQIKLKRNLDITNKDLIRKIMGIKLGIKIT